MDGSRDAEEKQAELSVLGRKLEPCSLKPLTGFYRDGCCSTGPEDRGSHTVCAQMTATFLAFSKAQGNDLSTFDFASDERRQKRNARVMLRMVMEINTRHLAEVPEPRPADKPAVTCYTCHRGQDKPLTAAPKG